jgi:hypothetical protein
MNAKRLEELEPEEGERFWLKMIAVQLARLADKDTPPPIHKKKARGV